jgi:hypothetical protein
MHRCSGREAEMALLPALRNGGDGGGWCFVGEKIEIKK